MNLLEEIARAIVSAHTADLHGEVDPSIVENEWFDWLPEARSILPIIEKAVQAGLSHGRARIDTLSASEIVKEMCGE